MASLLLMSVCAILMAAVTKVCTVLLLYSDTIQNSYELFTKTLQVQLLYNARDTLSFIMLVIFKQLAVLLNSVLLEPPDLACTDRSKLSFIM